MHGRALVLTGACTLLLAAACRGDDPTRLTPERSLVAGHAHGVEAVAYSAGGKWTAPGGVGGAGRLWDAGAAKVAALLEGHTAKVAALAFPPDGRLLVSASWDKTVRVWKVPAGEPVAVLPDHAAP